MVGEGQSRLLLLWLRSVGLLWQRNVLQLGLRHLFDQLLELVEGNRLAIVRLESVALIAFFGGPIGHQCGRS